MSVFTVDDSYIEEQQHHHHQPPNGQSSSTDDVRPHHSFPGYPGTYPPHSSTGGPSMAPGLHDGLSLHHPASAISARTGRRHSDEEDDTASLFGDIPEARKRKFILVEDPSRSGGRVRVRVTLDTVDTKAIPDSYRRTNSVYPRSWFPMQMQSPPPSAHGSRFFEDDDVDDVASAAAAADVDDDDDALAVDRRGPPPPHRHHHRGDESGGEGSGGRRRGGGPAAFGKTMVQVPILDGGFAEVAVPKMRRTQRGKEVKLNDLGYRMAWQQSRVFAGKRVFLQRACEFLSPFPFPFPSPFPFPFPFPVMDFPPSPPFLEHYVMVGQEGRDGLILGKDWG